ncbi:TlpA family protein disulfide reductase [Serinibacter salmoneus]|uniref:Thioredoxin n=1 Tax=Serinibacter salmoneus TaxID=556530 RepID=A0A2A9D4R5_9MICO|nr:thioredoxin family protein [Serinibacter salmoneus]PFG21245.1 hypothetical protein ATL40_2868 [Serinibacter salmoneus]
MTALIILALVAISTALGLWWRSRQGRTRAVDRPLTLADVPGLTAGDAPGVRGPLVLQVSSATCSPCRATARTWGSLGVAHREVLVEERPEVAEALGVWHTPTSFLFDADGALISRIDGAPTRAAAAEALQAIDAPAGAR